MRNTLLLTLSFYLVGIASATAQKVGIGTTTPLAKLHIAAPDSGLLVLQNTQSLNTDIDNGLFFNTGGYYTGAVKTIGQTNLDARLGFFTFSSGNALTLKERLSILDNGNVGINTTTPTNTVDINGTLRIRGGSPGAGKVLTSDANGVASWQTPAAPAFIAFRTVGLIDNAPLATGIGTWTKVVYAQSPQYNYGLGYQGIAGNFVAPVKGLYHFDVRIEQQEQYYDVYMRLIQRRNNINYEAAFIRNTAITSNGNGVVQYNNMTISTDLMVEAGDTFWVEAYAPFGFIISPAARSNWFGAHLVQAL